MGDTISMMTDGGRGMTYREALTYKQNEIAYFNGYAVKMSGEVRTIYGGEFQIGTFVEGPRVGKECAIKMEVER
jgi:hypothetical protein